MLARRLLFATTAHTSRYNVGLRNLRPTLRFGSLSQLDYRSYSVIIHEPPHEELRIPYKTMWDILEEQLSVHADKSAFIDGITHQHMTFKQLYDRARRLAIALAKRGVKKGDGVIVHSLNCIDYPTVVLALTSLGAVCSPASPAFLPTELAAQIKAATAKYVITHKDLEKAAIEASKLCGVDKSLIFTFGQSTEDLQTIDDLVKDGEDPFFQFEKIDSESKIFLPFSSGTTGVPKGVALSARNILSNAMQVNHVEKMRGYSLGLLPFYHIYGMMQMHLSMYQGAANVVLPRFEPETFLNVLSTYKICVAYIAPPVALFLAHHPLVDKYDISATEIFVSGGAPMGKEVEKLVKDRVHIAVKQAYGLTEASPAVNYSEDSHHKPGSVGRLLPNTQLRVKCTETDKDLDVGEHGELLYKGPQVMLGYLNNEEANAKVFTEDRFLRTGDTGYIDEDGCVFIVDRVKELIKYKGHQVAPAELEDVLNHHPQILDACCIRGSDAMGEEVPKAFVVLKDPTNAAGLTKEELMDFVASKVAPFKKVRQIEFIDSIPKSPTGKILRRELQDYENQHHIAKVA
ncbi:4coumarate ligase [Plasmopara halstedii]|uniref:4coumarate ligase n=1 Tax=Plasmopara halstedii TaxID=4781 RepID=A0A0P1ABB3_PLAHL|nr:4coumarate ligase [Plasmopara halstedii]CEG37925.1 4coumarate ligase [Plasmopara halstedii]|eukprot:XP_024574294.1 4coumarate ligase [Plasmopara halstedii]